MNREEYLQESMRDIEQVFKSQGVKLDEHMKAAIRTEIKWAWSYGKNEERQREPTL